MIKIVILVSFIIGILLILKKKSNSNIYGKLILLIIVLAILFLIATSGRFLLPQIIQLLKIGLPLISKFIGI